MNITKKKYIVSISLAYIVGNFIPVIVYEVENRKLKSVINDFIDSAADAHSSDTRMNLHIAKSIRNNKPEDALFLLEGSIRRNVESFTHNGSRYKYLSEVELGVYEDVKGYWENNCIKQCLSDLEYIFNDKYGHQVKANN